PNSAELRRSPEPVTGNHITEPSQQPQPEPSQPQPERNDIWQELDIFFDTTELPALPARINDWSTDIAELETFFTAITIPSEPIRLNPWTRIADPRSFWDAHLQTGMNNNGNQTFLRFHIGLMPLRGLIPQVAHQFVESTKL